MRMRTRVYDSIVEWLSDHSWHGTDGLRRLTSFPEYWLEVLEREPAFEIDVERRQIRLRTPIAERLTA